MSAIPVEGASIAMDLSTLRKVSYSRHEETIQE